MLHMNLVKFSFTCVMLLTVAIVTKRYNNNNNNTLFIYLIMRVTPPTLGGCGITRDSNLRSPDDDGERFTENVILNYIVDNMQEPS